MKNTFIDFSENAIGKFKRYDTDPNACQRFGRTPLQHLENIPRTLSKVETSADESKSGDEERYINVNGPVCTLEAGKAECSSPSNCNTPSDDSVPRSSTVTSDADTTYATRTSDGTLDADTTRFATAISDADTTTFATVTSGADTTRFATVTSDADLSPLRPLDAKKDADSLTTMMLRNVPNRYTQRELVTDLRLLGFAPGIDVDFFYLPIDLTTGSNLGYCFINLTHSEATERFKWLHGERLPRYYSRKSLIVNLATCQGLHANWQHYQRSSVINAEDSRRPLFWPAEVDWMGHNEMLALRCQWGVSPGYGEG